MFISMTGKRAYTSPGGASNLLQSRNVFPPHADAEPTVLGRVEVKSSACGWEGSRSSSPFSTFDDPARA